MDDSPATRDPAATGDVAVVAELLGSSASALLPLYANRAARVDHLLDVDHGFLCFRVWNLRFEHDGPPPRELGSSAPCGDRPSRPARRRVPRQRPSVPVLIVAGRYVRLSQDCRSLPLLTSPPAVAAPAAALKHDTREEERLEEGDAV